MKKIISLLLFTAMMAQVTLAPSAFAVGKIQNEDVKSLTELTGAGGSISQLINTSKIYDATNGQQLSTSISNGALGGGGGGAGGIELIPNPNFESNGIVNGWTNTGGTFAAVTSGANLLFQKTSASFLATAIGQTVQSTAVAVQGLSGTNCSVGIYYTYAGTNGDYSVQAYDTTTSTVIATYALPKQTVAAPIQPATFTCPNVATDTIQWRLISNVTTPSIIYFDNTHNGSFQVGTSSQAVLLGGVKVTGCSGSWQSVNPGSTPVAFAAQTGCTYSTFGNAAADTAFGSTQLPAIKFALMPAGDYRIEYEGTIGPNGSAGTVQTNQFTDGSITARELSSLMEASAATGGFPGISQSFSYTNAKSNVTWQLFAGLNDGNNTQVFGTTAKPGVFKVYYFPSAQSQTINTNITPGSWSGYHTVAGGWTTGSATFADPSSGTTVVLNQATSRNISCVTASGSLPGVTCTLPRTGLYDVCAIPGITNNTTQANPSFRLVDGSGTIIDPGKSFEVATALLATANTVSLCGHYNASSVGSAITFKVQAATNGGTAQIINGTASGSSAIQWKIIELDAALPSPVLISSKYVVSYRDAGHTYAAGDIVQFNTLDIDNTGGAVTTGASWKFLPNHSGYYRVCSVSMVSGVATQEIYAYKNGVQNKFVSAFQSGSASALRGGSCPIIQLNGSTDYLDIRSVAGLSNWTSNGFTQSTVNSNYIDINEL